MSKVKAIPDGMHTRTPHLVCAGAADAIEFYKLVGRHAPTRCDPRLDAAGDAANGRLGERDEIPVPGLSR